MFPFFSFVCFLTGLLCLSVFSSVLSVRLLSHFPSLFIYFLTCLMQSSVYHLSSPFICFSPALSVYLFIRFLSFLLICFLTCLLCASVFSSVFSVHLFITCLFHSSVYHLSSPFMFFHLSSPFMCFLPALSGNLFVCFLTCLLCSFFLPALSGHLFICFLPCLMLSSVYHLSSLFICFFTCLLRSSVSYLPCLFLCSSVFSPVFSVHLFLTCHVCSFGHLFSHLRSLFTYFLTCLLRSASSSCTALSLESFLREHR